MRRPSIFEIATAFEDGRNGEIKQKEKGLYETFQEDLSEDEKSFVIRRPLVADMFNRNSKKSKKNWKRIRGYG